MADNDNQGNPFEALGHAANIVFVTTSYGALGGSLLGAAFANSIPNAIHGGVWGLVAGGGFGALAGIAGSVVFRDDLDTVSAAVSEMNDRILNWGSNAFATAVQTGVYGAIAGALWTDPFKLFDLGMASRKASAAVEAANSSTVDATTAVITNPQTLEAASSHAHQAYEAALNAFTSHIISGGEVGVAFGLAASAICLKYTEQLRQGVRASTALTLTLTGLGALIGGAFGALHGEFVPALRSVLQLGSIGFAAFVPAAAYFTMMAVNSRRKAQQAPQP